MDNIQDWLYIVFLIVAGVSSIFSSSKKKKQPKEILGNPAGEVRNTPPNTPREKGFWEVLQEMQESTNERKTRPTTSETSDAGQRRKKNSAPKENKTATSPFLTGEGKQAGMRIPFTENPHFAQEEEYHTPVDISFTDANDLRKAVVYSEILARRY